MFCTFFASGDFWSALFLHFRNAKISFTSDILFSPHAITLLNASIASVVLISAVVTMHCSWSISSTSLSMYLRYHCLDSTSKSLPAKAAPLTKLAKMSLFSHKVNTLHCVRKTNDHKKALLYSYAHTCLSWGRTDF